MKYAIACKIGDHEEYLREQSGADCFSDDIGNAVLFHNWRNIPFNVMDPTDYIVKVGEDEDGGMWVIGILSQEEMEAAE